MPLKPETVYRNEGWKGWGDFTGTGNIHGSQKEYLSYENAKKIVFQRKIKTTTEWKIFCKGDSFPGNLPKNPPTVYKNKGWISWSDFLKSDRPSPKDGYLPFEPAKEYVHTLKIESQSQWRLFCKSGKKPKEIPNAPHLLKQYSDQWTSWGDWLGTGRVADQNRIYRKFKSARDFARKLGLSSESKWRLYCKSGEKPEDIPSAPHNTYRDKGWKGWKDWLGND